MPRIYCLSDRAIQIDWAAGELPKPAASQAVALAALRQTIQEKLSSLVLKNSLQHSCPQFQCIQADQSITLLFAQALLPPHSLQAMCEELQVLVSKAEKKLKAVKGSARRHVLAVHYGGSAGQDLDWLARQTGLSTEGVIELHTQAVYTVQFLGFLPGFAYLTGLPEALHFPRRANPRPRVPAGTLAVGTHYCAVYPWESPGGWHLLGHVEQVLFDPEPAEGQAQSILQAGDTVQFIRAEHA